MDYPFNDENMQYDYRAHRYVLTPDCVLNELGENLALILNSLGDANQSTLPQRFLNRVSMTVYNYLYEDIWNKDWQEYLLATAPFLREAIREMLLAQTLYVLNNDFVSGYAGINIAKGSVIDVAVLRGRAKVADEVEQIAYQVVPELGRSLKYVGPMPFVPAELRRRGY